MEPTWVPSTGGPLIVVPRSALAAWGGCTPVALLLDGTEDCGTWETDGPAVLMDSATAGTDLGVPHPVGGGLPDQAPVVPPPGRRGVRAAETGAPLHLVSARR
ncbi:Imm21 family immunity protein [Kitasatospora sp. NPDC090308]|uniref:Imm21 family immunity protein n=1 Tax=Kitasatospora sp. NPDC090308 TaxID=3364082 RepID=UPI003810E1F4